ncbi:transcriptional regulatory protein pro1 [Aspergillus lentulus]|uniref:Transcriptional regulatory protein pro1 n=1 Tax=Aspergillus lentulus TaxID=293939 RepID=A0AAN4T715_ASPLE|nr:transcriptional regulatory protein pro1 [Aspergillus lentulus]
MMSSSYVPSTMLVSASGNGLTLGIPDSSQAVDDSNAKSFKRSRSGCYTCRLRRKKCDEERPACTACTKLGLKCDYKPPQWWVSAETRRMQKERIKDRIRQTKVMEKHGSLQEYMERIRELAQKPSATAEEYDFNRPVFANQYNYNPFVAPLLTPVTPFNVDIRTDHDTALSNVPLPYGTSLATLNSMAPQPQFQVTSPLTPASAGLEWSQNTLGYTQPYTILSPTGLPYQQKPVSAELQTMIPLDAHDRPLLNHFVDKVLPSVFPILEVQQQGPARLQEIMHSLQTNKSYLHCCLSASAIHLKTSRGLTDQMDYDIMRHRYEAISQLCRTLNGGPSHEQVLDATLAMIFYHSSVGETHDYLPDIPWSAHFKAVSSLVNKPNCAPTQFNVSLITWIDILGATMLGQTPHFAHTYRTKHLSGTSSGLQQLMGCDDRVMYLISEIACLESLRLEGRVDDLALSQHVSALDAQIEWTESADRTLETPYLMSGLMPEFGCYAPSSITLVASVGEILQCLPAGPAGFDRCLVWPLFIAGAASAPYSGYRKILTDRVAAMGRLSDFGSLGRMYRVLQELWKQSDDPIATSSSNAARTQDGVYSTTHESTESAPQQIRLHWRKLMQHKKWDYLLI